MPVRHVVLLRFTPDATEEQLAHFRAGLDALPTNVGNTGAYRHGNDLDLNQGTFDYAIVADFADLADYEQYRDHPWHRQMIDERMKPILAERAAVQYEIDA
jgi:hypothetical protein